MMRVAWWWMISRMGCSGHSLKSFWSVQLVDKRRIWFHWGWANLWKCYAPFLETQCRYILNLLIDWWKHWMRCIIIIRIQLSAMHYPSIKPNFHLFFPFHTSVMVRWCRSCFPFPPPPPRSLSQDDWVPLSTPIRGPLPTTCQDTFRALHLFLENVTEAGKTLKCLWCLSLTKMPSNCW